MMILKNFCLIGKPVSHSLSPLIHSHFICKSNLNAGYIALHIENLDVDVLKFLKGNFAGFNITLPYKEDIIAYLNGIDSIAQSIGAVNCVKNVNGELVGYNTDYYGVKKTFEKFKVKIYGKRVLVLGCGGASRPLYLYLKNEKYEELIICNRTISKAYDMVERFELEKVKIITLNDLLIDEEYDIIINTTSVGIDGGSFFDMSVKAKEFVFDMQYSKDGKTPFLSKFDNCLVTDGLHMLLFQALKSFEIWNNLKLQINIDELLLKMRGKNGFY